MKRCWIILLALALTLTVCACKNKAESAPTPEPETTETAEPTATAAPVNTELGSGTFDTYSASFVGAEKFTAADGSEALRVYFDFKNLSDEAVSASDRLLYTAVQDGNTLNWANSAEPLEEQDNLLLRLQPGNEIRCILQFALVSDSTVAVSLSDVANQSVSALLVLDRLPGAPETAAASQPQKQAEETELDSQCTLYDLYTVTLLGGELDEDGKTLTVSLEFTNKADPESVYPWDWLWLYAYQDGLELLPLLSEQEELLFVDRGETVTVTRTYELRSDTSVLLELFGFREEEPSAGLVISVAE